MNKLLKTSIICIALLAVSIAIADDKDPALKWKKTIDKFSWYDRQNSFPKDAILFIGSSSIVGWETQTSFPKYKVINRGFGGSQISDVNYYAHRIVAPYKPQLIIFYCGDNDIAAGKSPQRVANDYKQFVTLARKGSSKQSIVFVAIKPCKSRWKLWPKMQQTNQMIKDFCQNDKRLYYVDTSTKLIGADGLPTDKYFRNDKLHMTPAGYTIWNDMVRPYIKAHSNAKK